MAVVVRKFPDFPSWVAATQAHIVRNLAEGIGLRGPASLVVSGGKTPVPLFESLAECPLDWDRITVTLADERWVAADDAESNERLVRSHLLCNGAAGAKFIPLKIDDSTFETCVADLGVRLEAVPRPFDMVVLGLGEDGHTASLFPDAPELERGFSTHEAALMLHPAGQANARLSLSAHSLLQSREIILFIQGTAKLRILEQALEPGPISLLPVRAFLHQDQVPVTVYWSA